MKKVLFILLNFLTVTVMAQTKGRFEVHDLLHVYYTNDALGDASYIIEGKDALVTMEQPLFKDNVAEFDSYLSTLEKPVEKRITDYHVGGTWKHDVVMAQGMPEFTKGEIYGGMMKGFEHAFGDALTDMPTGKATEVAFGTTQTWAGVTFEFRHGATTDFPGASILIGGKAYYTHWTPAKAHVRFIGGHGGAAARDAVEFKIAYLKKMKELLAANETAQAFVDAMKQAWPGLPGEAGLEDLGKALYK